MFKISEKINSSILIYISLAVSQVASLIIVLVTSKYLSSEEFSKIVIFETYLFLFQAITCVSIEKSATRYFLKDSDLVISLTMKISTLSFLIIFILVYIILLIYEGESYILLACFAAYVYTIQQIILVKYQFTKKYFLYFIFYTIKNILLMIIPIFILLNNNAEIYNDVYFKGFFVSSVLLLIFCLLQFNKSYSINKKKCKQYLTYCVPYIPTVLASWVINWSSRFILSGKVSSTELVNYALAQKYSFLILLFSQAITIIISPKMYKLLENNSYLSLIGLLKRYLIFYILICFLIIGFGTYVISLVYYQDNFNSLSYYYVLFVIVFGINGMTGFTNNIIFSHLEKTKIQMYIYLFISIITFIAYYFTSSLYGIFGVIISSLVSAVLMLLIPNLILKYKYDFYQK